MSAEGRPAVHVGPDEVQALVDAVREGGGTPAPLDQSDGLVWTGLDPAEMPRDLPERVRWVQLPSAGVERWFEAGVIDHSRVYTSAVGAYAPPVAEHAVALLLACARRLGEAARARTWGAPAGVELAGRTVAIVGAGGIGREIIARLAGWNTEIIAVTRRGRPVEGAASTLPAERTDEVWGVADFIVLAAPATARTRHLVGRDQLAAMRSDAWLINVARGSLVDHDALAGAVRDHEIAGAALDVTEPEPLPDDHPLWQEPRVLITPHVANPPEAVARALRERVRENVERLAAGRDLVGRIDPDAGY